MVKPEVYQIGFEGDNALYWGPDAPNNPNEPNLVWCDGIEAISDPVYDAEQSKINPKNDPFCVTKNSTSLVAAVVLKLPESLSFSTSIYIDAAGTEEWLEQFASFGFGGISVSADLPVDPNVVNTVKVYSGNFNMAWKYKVPLGTDKWYDIETTKHTVYVTWGTPDPGGSDLTVKRIDWACTKANDANSVKAVADGIHSGLNGDPPLDGPQGSTYIDTWELMAGSPYSGYCNDQARFMVRVLKLLGATGTDYLTFASTDATVTSFQSKLYGGKTWFLVFDFNHDGQVDNRFEGSVSAAGHYYAVWPSLDAASECGLLRQVGPDKYKATQRWVTTDNGTFWGRWMEHFPGTVDYPACP